MFFFSLLSPALQSVRHRSWWAPPSLDSAKRFGKIIKPEEQQYWGPKAFCCASRELSLTFWYRALSRDSTFICSFLRLAWRATPSELALARTWAISSLALTKRRGDIVISIHGNHSEAFPVNSMANLVSLLPLSHRLSTYFSSFSSAWIFKVWYRCSSCFTRARYSCAHFFSTSSFWWGRKKQVEEEQLIHSEHLHVSWIKMNVDVGTMEMLQMSYIPVIVGTFYSFLWT